MEVLSKNSRIKSAEGTSSISVADSLLSFSDYYYRHIDTNTPSDKSTKILNFNILPSMTSEIYPEMGHLITEWQVKDQDGNNIATGDQPSELLMKSRC